MTTPSPTSTSSATASCTSVAPQGPYGYIPVEACNANWAYSPSFPAAVAVSTIFGVLTVAHIALAILFRKGFCWVIIMGAGWELVSFITRALGAHRQDIQAYAYTANIFFLLAPLWINAYIYMTAGRLIWTYHHQKKVWFCKAASIGKYFVWLDIFSFLVQGAGGSMLSPGNSAKTMELGKNIYMGGIGIQEFFILLFLSIVVKFMMDVQKTRHAGTGYFSERWQLVTYSIFASLVLITIRIIFRIVEFSAGTDISNPLPTHEGYAYGLDAVPMILAVGILAVLHSGLALQGPESEFPSRKERKLEKKRRKAEKKALKSMGKMSTNDRQEHQGIKEHDSTAVELNRV
ncbi:hypothetical protein DM02DRAFT_616795 [Periconia macrospinosa]|uniref:RTA1-domain-containing protein n=1 Tax=Periconia macrospinosa TaxID=97972 RepID=A0A2V1DFV1_9PLEO|nr:hypothetical protein DM02DRAFT_616795 [Periconia macrospinosa]